MKKFNLNIQYLFLNDLIAGLKRPYRYKMGGTQTIVFPSLLEVELDDCSYYSVGTKYRGKEKHDNIGYVIPTRQEVEEQIKKSWSNSLHAQYFLESLLITGERVSEEKEKIIVDSNDVAIAIAYAKFVIGGPWPLLEEKLLKNKNLSSILKYCLSIKGKWEQAEEIIKKTQYIFEYGLRTNSELHENVFEEIKPSEYLDYHIILNYHREIIKKRWFEFEIFLKKCYEEGYVNFIRVIKKYMENLESHTRKIEVNDSAINFFFKIGVINKEKVKITYSNLMKGNIKNHKEAVLEVAEKAKDYLIEDAIIHMTFYKENDKVYCCLKNSIDPIKLLKQINDHHNKI